MTSSMLAGERRWASARRGGMTVLGKVAVPKPINLPSQRLENHGLDPSVEIVPKGTVSWGSRSTPSATNAWGSSKDGGAGSPSHLSGRPSSGGGSSTRPSTADSERTHEPAANAWGPNSRPLSASGILVSGQTSQVSSRPRSAETRPRSSQLSRFAGPPSENFGAWGPSNAAEKLGISSSKKDEFALSSGDFPTLGSEKENLGKNTESQDHGSYSRPHSSSGGTAKQNDRNVTSPVGDASANSNVKGATVNTWRRDSFQHVEDGVRPCLDKWQGDPQSPFINTNVPQQFDAWHGPQMNAPPAGVWYRGPPGGPPPYGGPVPPPGGFPMEAFPYYRPQIPANALGSSQGVPLPGGTGPRGPHPKSGDMFRPHGPDAFIHPGMQIRPGFYHGPVPYDGYYGPPMGYCNSNERDIPLVGMAAGQPVYSRYPGNNAPDHNNNYGRPSSHGSTGKTMVQERVDSAHLDDNKGPYKVLLKQHNEWDGKNDEGKSEQSLPSSWKTEEIRPRRVLTGEGAPSQTYENREGYSLDTGKHKLPERKGNLKAVEGSLGKESENTAPSLQEEVPVLAAIPKDPSLIQKVEGLNAKARTSDGRHDIKSFPGSEGQKNRVQINARANHSGNAGVSRARADGDVTENKNLPPAVIPRGASHGEHGGGTTTPRGASHGEQGRLNHREKKTSAQDSEGGWRKKPLAAESTSVVSAANVGSTISVKEQEGHTVSESPEESGIISLQEKAEGESLMFDPSDLHAQRAKMREIAQQRAKQLQKEEEERTKEQKAKALAKLEELNRRIQSTDGSTQKTEKVPPSGLITQKETEESQPLSEPPMVVAGKSETPSPTPDSEPNVVGQASDNSSAYGVVESIISSGDTLTDPAESVADSKADSGRKHYKQKQNISSEKNLTEKSGSNSKKEAPKNDIDVTANAAVSVEVVSETRPRSESGYSINPSGTGSGTVEVSTQQRRKNSRNGKSKQKPDDPPPNESKLVKASSDPDLDPNSVQPSKPRLPSEEAHGRLNNPGRSQQPSRRMPRAPQGHRSAAEKFHGTESVVWAPVRSQNKPEVIDEANPKTLPDVITPAVKYDNNNNNLKSKRAEMERYVPKPVVAKELAHQQTSSSSVNHAMNEAVSENSQSSGSSIGNVKESKHSKSSSSKGQASWRQRATTTTDISTFPSNPRKDDVVVEESVVINPKDDGNFSDGWTMPDCPEPTTHVAPPKEHGGTVRGKRNAFKGGHRSTGNNNSNNNNDRDYRNKGSVGDGDRSYGENIITQIDVNRGTGDRTSQWQPKSAHNHGGGGHKDYPLEGKNMENLIAGEHREVKRDRRGPGRGHSLNQGPINTVEHMYTNNTDGHHHQQQHPHQKQFHKNGGNNNNQNNSRSVGERQQRQSSHYEYQPVGGGKANNNFEGSIGGGGTTKYRERGQGSSTRRGGGGGAGNNFYGRQSGGSTVQVDDGGGGYD